MKRILQISFLLFSITSFSQRITFEEIQSKPDIYLYGVGEGINQNKADADAFDDLISQIQVNVSSEFSTQLEENINGENMSIEEKTSSIVRTYSSATLSQAERIIISEDPIKVCRYIKRSSIREIFEARKNKVLDFIEIAEKAEKEYRIADALKYNYWALVMLKSLPSSRDIKVMDEDGDEDLLGVELPRRINRILDNISMATTEKESSADKNLALTIEARYKGVPVSNLDFTYWDGIGRSDLQSLKDGIGKIYMYNQTGSHDDIIVDLEYVQADQWSIDKDLTAVMNESKRIKFKNANIVFSPDVKKVKTPELKLNSFRGGEFMSKSEVIPAEKVESVAAGRVEISDYKDKMADILKAISSKNYKSAAEHFTPEGLKMYNELLAYGKAEIISLPKEPIAIKINNETVLRSVPMKFSFPRNNRSFTEDVNFIFDENQKVCAISFSLSKIAIDDIMKKSKWPEADKYQLINFMENYKTAYCLKRLDYLKSIFDEDALIIVGHVVKQSKDAATGLYQNEKVEFNKYTKKEYMDKLKVLFQTKEYVNIQFENNEVLAGKYPHTYGIQIKQNYYSSNYGDQGYLFLLIDFQDPKKPMIYVRTWQPDKDSNGQVFGIQDFN